MIGVDLERTDAFDGERLKLSGAVPPGFKLWTSTFERAPSVPIPSAH